MACDAEDCGFQMLNDDEIVTSVHEESDPVDDKMDEDEDNNSNESRKVPSNADAFSTVRFHVLHEWHSVIRTIAYPNGVLSQLIQINDVLLYMDQRCARTAKLRFCPRSFLLCLRFRGLYELPEAAKRYFKLGTMTKTQFQTRSRHFQDEANSTTQMFVYIGTLNALRTLIVWLVESLASID
ncbi:hypothetical protein TNCV_3185371 [Trichonephila clavipes]|nr:hypothetical protein TNCV_3185371 [Trichonephila clavipes]